MYHFSTIITSWCFCCCCCCSCLFLLQFAESFVLQSLPLPTTTLPTTPTTLPTTSFKSTTTTTTRRRSRRYTPQLLVHYFQKHQHHDHQEEQQQQQQQQQRQTPTRRTLRLLPNHYFLYKSSSTSTSSRHFGSTTILSSRSQQQNTEEEKQLTTKTRQKRRTWEECFQLLVSYKEKHGNCNVPNIYKEDLRLGRWVDSQRQRKDRLSDERIAKLDDLGFSWANEIFDEQWEECFQLLVSYKERYGNCNVPNRYKDDLRLGYWVKTQRLRKSLISKERRARLDKLGLIWEDANKAKADQKWNEQYERLREYKQKYGHCRVPKKWKEYLTLGLWVYTQRQRYRKGQLREDRQMKLEQMDFTWKVRDGNEPDYVKLDLKWFVMYGILLNFLEEHGHCDVPHYYKEDKSLAFWVYTQRTNQRLMTLHEDRKERLDDIGFTWNFDDQKDEQWNETYKELKRFKEQNGHLRLPETSKSLSSWVSWQRIQFAAGRVDPERKALLDEIDFRWEIQTRST